MQEDYWYDLKATLIRNTEISAATEEGEKRGERRGEKRGREKEKVEIAKKLLNIGLSIEQIIEATGLTKKEIEKVKRKSI